MENSFTQARINLIWEREGMQENISFAIGELYSHPYLTANISCKSLEYGELYTLQLNPKNIIKLKELSFSFEPEVQLEDKMLVNRHHNWLESREMGALKQMKPVQSFIRERMGIYGEENIIKAPKKAGHFQSWTYTYFRRVKQPLLLMGSIDESFAFTVFDYNFHQNQLIIKKELNYLLVEKDCIPFQIYIGKGEENHLWNEYISLIQQYRQPLEKITGWTSRHCYNEIDEETIISNLNALRDSQIPLDIFQIESGYQKRIGDWVDVNQKFPSGMKYIAERIKEQGYHPGIWLAPFVCEGKSEIYNEHPEWLLEDAKGQPIKVGKDHKSKGWLYALDFYAYGFKDHLRKVFETILDEWGFEMVSLDFLYAVALRPSRDKSRGQIMTEVLAFLREVVGDRWVLGDRLPFGSAFGQVDFCRIGSDVTPYWDKGKITRFHKSEYASVFNSIMNSMIRCTLNGKVFLNDPEVFMLRNHGNKLTKEQRYTLFVLNNLFGGAIFFSDDIREYTDEEMKWLKSMFPKVAVEILTVKAKDNLYQINCNILIKEYQVYANFTDKRSKIILDQPSFSEETGFLSAGAEVELDPYQTACFHLVMTDRKLPYLLGSQGHIFPGAQVASFTANGEEVEIDLVEGAFPETEIYIGVPNRFTNIKVNGKFCSVKLTNRGSRYVAVKI